LATAEFTSGVFYRYSSINIGHLARNMGGSVDEALTITDAYLRAFTTAIPGGKQNVTAATTRPDLVYLALRRDPLSLAAAFEKPVLPARDGGHAEPSRKRLNDYAGQLERFLGTGPLWSGYASVDTAEYTHLGTPAESLDTLIVNATTAASDQPIPVGAV
ncbi:MAG TPA: type I-E CRISPR-associated protein Cas7/Cse4/CasC, partial [Amycolatopsis sp.]|uniref:type I-E CRISPR-associated protein Cas7/Cse4/CasC n=1 Tax=Amycolatopsis sp. TaxID=37632 RepID=UPI002B48CA53